MAYPIQFSAQTGYSIGSGQTNRIGLFKPSLIKPILHECRVWGDHLLKALSVYSHFGVEEKHVCARMSNKLTFF